MMDVHCPQCGTVFEFDERLMRGVSATLQCSVCQHVFTIRASHRQAEQENQPRWMVRTHHSGDILYFRGFDELHKWILERKIDQQDQISRTGRKWTVLADIGEFAPIFQVVESISQLTDPPPSPSKAPKTEVPDAVRDRQLTMQQFPNRSMYDTPAEPNTATFSENFTAPAPSLDEVSEGELRATTEMQRTTREAAFASLSQPIEPPSLTPQALTTEPSFAPEPDFVEPPAVDVQEQWSFGQGPEVNNTHSMMEAVEEPFEPRPKRTGLIVAVVLFLALAAGAGYLFTFERARVDGWLGLTSTPPVTQKDPKAPKIPDKPPEPKAPEWMVQTQAGVHKAVDAGEGIIREQMLAQVDKGVIATHDVLGKAHKKAMRSIEKELMKSDIKLVLKKAKKALRGKKAKRARSLYHQALEIDSHNVTAIVGLGWSLLSLGNPGAAAAQFKKALHVNSLSEDAYIGLGKAERARGNLKAALSAYDNYLERFPTGKKASIARYQRKQLRAALGM